MFTKFIEQITTAFVENGSIEAHKDERSIVAFILAQLATMVLAEPEAILTPAELAQMRERSEQARETFTQIISETGQKEIDTCRSLVEALNRCRVLKAYSGHADITQQTSDEWWRETDLLQADLEIALDRIDPGELNQWLESKW
jgi:hypothetical protein